MGIRARGLIAASLCLVVAAGCTHSKNPASSTAPTPTTLPKSLLRLESIVPSPPSLPHHEVTWDDAEKALGFGFSPSYRAFLDRYGAGGIGNLTLLDPQDPQAFRDYAALDLGTLHQDRADPSNDQKSPPYLPFPTGHAQEMMPIGTFEDLGDLWASVSNGELDDSELWVSPIDAPVTWTSVPAPLSNFVRA